MHQSSYWLGVVFGVIVFVTVFIRLRNYDMKERYSTWWIVIAISSVVFSVFPNLLNGLSRALGVLSSMNLAFFGAGVVLLLLSLRLSVDLSHDDEERRRLAEEIALLRQEVEQLKQERDQRPPKPGKLS